MNELCFLPNLTSTEWAAWVQAVGSVAAIVAAAWIAKHQASLQYKNALDLHKIEKRTEKHDIAKTLSVLATNASVTMKHITNKLKDRDSVHKAADGTAPCNLGEVNRVDAYLREIPLHTVPDSMVTSTMILGSTVRQFKEKVEMALKHHRKMDSEMFKDFFQTIKDMNKSIEETCSDINAEVKRLAD